MFREMVTAHLDAGAGDRKFFRVDSLARTGEHANGEVTADRNGAGESGEAGGGLGEAAEADHGGEGGNGEAAEGGVVNLLTASETYDETINGARLVLSFDAASNAFVGTVENTTNGPLTRARVEVHLSNGTELGPTTPTDLAPGQILPIRLSSTTATFDTWSAHPGVGAAEGGEMSEGGGESGGETGPTAASATYLTTNGISRGVVSGPELLVDDAYADKHNGLESVLTYDTASGSFLGRVKNEAN